MYSERLSADDYLGFSCRPGHDIVSDFGMNLVDIDSEHLGIPETEHNAIIKLPSADIARIC